MAFIPICEISVPLLLRLVKLERAGVDAVAQAGRLGTIFEDVAEVAAAAGALQLGAAAIGIGRGLDVVVDERPEARPARAGIELRVGVEKLQVARGAAIDSLFVVVEV